MLNPPSETAIRVLLVDDDQDDYLLTRDLLADIPGHPFELEWVAEFEAGLRAVARNEHDVYLVDYRLGSKTGLDLLAEARSTNPSAPVILLTGQGEWEIDLAAMQAGAADYLEKSRLDATLLERSIRHALLQKRYEADLARMVHERTVELERMNLALKKEVGERTRAEEALKQADRRKDEFLATLAHELRNPLAPIRNALEIMRLAGSNPQSLEQARKIMERQVSQMVRLIDDLLDVSRITRGKLHLAPENVELKAIIDAALEISRPQIDKAKLTLELELPQHPIMFKADRMRLAQVLSNLLNNAAKYTEAGGKVVLCVEQVDSQLKIIVGDTGIGIPSDVLPYIFELFTQVDRATNRSQGGLGIGLALVRRLVEMHGGTVTAHSAGPGQGAEFVILLPLASN